jgi:4-amino-4-deoxy-L-arabinose transferase-like glycosyltransferase
MRLEHELRRFLSSPYFIVLSLLGSVFIGLGSIPLFDLDEGAFTEATREMIASGIYSATYLDGEPRYDKPIFFYWIQASSIHLLGFNEWAFRLPSAIAACFWSWALFSFVREFSNRHRAIIACTILINTLWVALIARSAIADALLNLFLSLTLFDIWRYFSKNKLSILLRVYLWMALGTLTKGPIAVAVPLVVSIAYLLSIRAPLSLYRVYINPLGIALYLICVSPWLIAVYFEQGAGFFKGFILEHNLKRFSETRESHGGSLFYYFAALPLILLPFSGYVFILLSKLRRLYSSHLSRFLLIWFAVVFAVFSFSKTQLPHYILNSCVPLIVLFAMQIKLSGPYRLVLIAPLLLIAVFWATPTLLEIASSDSDQRTMAMLEDWQSLLPNRYWLFVSILSLSCVSVLVLPRLKVWQKLSLNGLFINIFMFTVFTQLVWNIQQKPVHDMIQFIDSAEHAATVVKYKIHMPSFSVYREQITPLRAPEADEWVLTRVDRLEELSQAKPKLQFSELYRSGALRLLQARNSQPEAPKP